MGVPEGDHGLREERGTDGGEGADTQRARAQAGEVGEFVFRGLQFAFDPFPSFGQRPSGVGGGDAPGVAFKEGLSCLRFQAADLLRYR